MKTYVVVLVVILEIVLLATSPSADADTAVLATTPPAPFDAGAASPDEDDWQTQLPVERFDPRIKSGGALAFAEAIFKGIVTVFGLFPESKAVRPEQFKLFERAVDVYASADKFAGSLEVGLGPNQIAAQVDVIEGEAKRLRALGTNNLFDPGRAFAVDWKILLTGTKDERNTAIDGLLTSIMQTRRSLYNLNEQRNLLLQEIAFDKKMADEAAAIGQGMVDLGGSTAGSIADFLLTGSTTLLLGVEIQAELPNAFGHRAQAAEAAVHRASEILNGRSEELVKLEATYRAAEGIHEARTRSEFAEAHPKVFALVRDMNKLQDARSRHDGEAVKGFEQKVEGDIKALMSPEEPGMHDDATLEEPATMEIGGQKVESITREERERNPTVYDATNLHVIDPETKLVIGDIYVDRDDGQLYYEKVEPYEHEVDTIIGEVTLPTDPSDDQAPKPEDSPVEQPASETPNPCDTGQLPPEDCAQELERPLWTDDTRALRICLKGKKTAEGAVGWKDTSSDCRIWRALYQTGSVDCPEGSVHVGGRCMDPVEAACLEDPAMTGCQHPPEIDPLTGCPRGMVMDLMLQTCRDPGPSPCDGIGGPIEQRDCVTQNEGIDCPEGTELQGGHCVDPAASHCENADASDIRCLPERFPICTLSLTQGPCVAPSELQNEVVLAPSVANDVVLTPPEAKAILALDPALVTGFTSDHIIQLDFQAESMDLAPSGTTMIPDFNALEVQGAASIGFIGRADSDDSGLKLVGMERYQGFRIVVTDASSLNAFEVPMTEDDFRVIASVSIHEHVFALVTAWIGSANAVGSLRRISPGSVETLLKFDPDELPLDITFFPGGDLAVLARKYEGSMRSPELLRLSQDGKVIWKKLYNSALLGSETDSLVAQGVLSGTGDDAVLLVGSARSAPWVMKVDGSGLPTWEKSYLYGSVSGEFKDGSAGLGAFALVGQLHMSAGDLPPDAIARRISEDGVQNPMSAEDPSDALVAKISDDGTLSWMRGCGGLAFDEAVGAAFVADGGLMVTGATKSKESATPAIDETRSWVMSFDTNGWLEWELGLGLGGAAVAAWENGSPHAATDRRTVGSFALRPSFNGSELNWGVPEVYPFVPHQDNVPGMLAEGAATCFDVVEQLSLPEQDFVETLRDNRLRGN